MEDKPVRFAIRVGVVKGDHSTAMFRGWKPSGEENRSILLWPRAKPLSAFSYILIHIFICQLNTDVLRLLCTNPGSENHLWHARHHLDSLIITQPWRYTKTAISLVQPSVSGSRPQERLPNPQERSTLPHKPAFSTIFPVCHLQSLRGRLQAPQQNEITPEGSFVKSANGARLLLWLSRQPRSYVKQEHHDLDRIKLTGSFQ